MLHRRVFLLGPGKEQLSLLGCNDNANPSSIPPTASDAPALSAGAGQALLGSWEDLPHPVIGTKAQGKFRTYRRSAGVVSRGCRASRQSPFGGACRDEAVSLAGVCSNQRRSLRNKRRQAGWRGSAQRAALHGYVCRYGNKTQVIPHPALTRGPAAAARSWIIHLNVDSPWQLRS